jgi:predicted amidophosphoribosyltransferase
VRAIMLLKFERIEALGRWFAERLLEVARREAVSADVVVPVPLHRQRERERGYNQAELVAKPLARKLGLPYRALLLTRTKPAQTCASSVWRSAGTRYVALLLLVRGAKLTTYAYCW